MLAWADAAVALVFLAVAVAGWRTRRRLGVLALLAVIGWLGGDVDERLLLVHRPLMLHVVLAFPDGRVLARYPRLLLAAWWVAALVQPLGVMPAVAIALAAAAGAEAWARWARPAWGQRRASRASSQALVAFALALAVPAVLRLGSWPVAVAPDTVIVVYDVLVATAGALLLTGTLLRSSTDETDAVIELSGATPGEVLDALRHQAAARTNPAELVALGRAVALLESNAALQAELAARVEEVLASRTRLLDTAAAERRRLERLLVDGAMTYLDEFAAVIRELADGADTTAAELVAACLDEVDRIREDLGQLARGLHPRALTDHGLAAALTELAATGPVPITVSAPHGRFPVHAETAVWYACAEALTNVAKYARATRAVVEVRVEAGDLCAGVRDDGVGGAHISPGGGLSGLVDRLAAVDGALIVEPAPDGGTEVRIRVPLT